MGGSCSCRTPNYDESFELDSNRQTNQLENRSQIMRGKDRRISSIEDAANPNHQQFMIVYSGNSQDFEHLQEHIQSMNLNGRLIFTKCYESEHVTTQKDQPNSFYLSGSSSEAINM